jgi:hydrogenase nickel incorporation protein HypB
MCEGHDHSHDNEHFKEEKKKTVNISVRSANDTIAHQNQHFLEKKKIFTINLMGSPGAGKTTFIEHIAQHLKNLAVIQGDLESDVDKVRLEKSGIPTYQINTHSGCHLNAKMINEALMDMDLKDIGYLIIENVGNLVCPADVKLGQQMNILISSTAEGSDKPKKYPLIFRDADIAVISKTDLIPYVGFDENIYMKDIRNIKGDLSVHKVEKGEPKQFEMVAKEIEHKKSHWHGHSHQH